MPISVIADTLIEQAASGERGGRRSRPIVRYGASARRQPHNLAEAAVVDDVHVACGIHRHAVGAVETGRRQHGRRGRRRRELHHLPVLVVDDIHVACGVHRHTVRVLETGQRQHCLIGRPGCQFHHPIVRAVVDIERACAVHRHVVAPTRCRRACSTLWSHDPAAQCHPPWPSPLARASDVYVDRRPSTAPIPGIVQARRTAAPFWSFEPAANFTTRLFSLSTTSTSPAGSTARPPGLFRPLNGSTVWSFDPAASFTTRLLWVSAT